MSAQPDNIQPFPAADTALETLVKQFIAAKQAEDAAKKHRIQIEERILAVAPTREEGSETVTLGNGFKVTTTGKLTYSGDTDAVRAACIAWPAELVPVKTRTELDETGCKYLRRERPDLWAQLAKVVTVKPAKASVKVGV